MATIIAPLSTAAYGKAVTTRSAFSRETTVSTGIKAGPAIIWALLTDAVGYPKWNPTIISLDGQIAPGNTIRLKSSLDPKRVFKLKVTGFTPEKTMTWAHGQGKRIFSLVKNTDGSVTFTMSEKIGGPLFPLFAGMVPSFDGPFESFANGLKKAAENEVVSKR